MMNPNPNRYLQIAGYVVLAPFLAVLMFIAVLLFISTYREDLNDD